VIFTDTSFFSGGKDFYIRLDNPSEKTNLERYFTDSNGFLE